MSDLFEDKQVSHGGGREAKEWLIRSEKGQNMLALGSCCKDFDFCHMNGEIFHSLNRGV